MNHHHHQRTHRLSVPPPIPTTRLKFPSSSTTPYPFSPSATPSKHRRPPLSHQTSSSPLTTLSSTLLFLFSLRTLYSLLPPIRSTPLSLSLFPFSFLLSLLSFLLSLFFPSSPSSIDPPSPLFNSLKQNPSLFLPIILKSILLTSVFLLRFLSLRSCGPAATILVEFSGSLSAASLSNAKDRHRRAYGFFPLIGSLFFLSNGWDKSSCFPRLVDGDDCVRFLPMVLPFLSGFLGFYWRSSNWPQLRLLGRRRTRHLSLGFSTVMLFFPALISFLVGERGGDGGGLFMNGFGWPLVNLVVFGVILSETTADERLSRDYRKEFLVTFFCTLVLELLYFPDFSLFGFSLCGILFWFAVIQLDSYMHVPELGFDSPETLYAIIVNPVKHILSERKSRKIALFLLINTAYMVVEFVAGFMSNSLGLISDACHMLFDCAALAIGLYASYISRLPANSQFNYGRGRFEVLSGYVNAVFLVLVGALIVLESLERILDPQEISTNSLLTVSVGGLMVNVVGLIFFHEEHHHAHGGVGACSHSHSHSHQDDRHHHHCMHDHQETRPDELQCISAHGSSSHEKPCSGDDHSYHKHEDHHPRGQTSEGIKDTDHHHSLNAHHDLNGRTEHDIHCHGDQHHHHVDEHVPVNSKDHKHSLCHESHTQNTLHHLEHDRTECHHDHHIDAHQQKHNDHHHLSYDHNNVKSKDNERFHCHGQHAHRESHGDKEDCCNNGCHSSLESNSLGSKGLLSGVEDGMFEPPRKHHHVDHNMEGIFLHVLADTMGSVGVVISTLLIKYKGWLVADPASSIFISVLIISSVIPLLKNSAEILLQRVPRAYEEDLKAALNDISKIGGVCGVRNAHLWSFTNMDIVGTLHLHILAEADKVSIKEKVSNILQDAGVKDMTVQIERL